MERANSELTSLDELYLQRAYELAARGAGSTSPNPCVGAVVVKHGRLLGEGYHYRAGTAHAETGALAAAGTEARGATLYVSLEPCGHVGRTAPCTNAVIAAGVDRVVIGTSDPSGHGGAADLQEHGISVTVASHRAAEALIEPFVRALGSNRPYVALKMAASLDGAVTGRAGVRRQLTGHAAQRYVRDLRIAYDAVMVGAQTVRIDDPQLTVRPEHARARPYNRIIACQSRGIDRGSKVLERTDGYAPTIVLAPRRLESEMGDIENVADVLYAGEEKLDLRKAMQTLRERDIHSVLCEGGPTLATKLIGSDFVDRFHWLIAPIMLRGIEALPVLNGTLQSEGVRVRFDRVEALGEDVLLSGVFGDV